MTSPSYSLSDIFHFFSLAQKSTYAAGLPPLKKSERADFFEYEFVQGDWNYRDSYTGHTKSAGQEIVRFKDGVVWANSYCGGMTTANEDLAGVTFDFLKEALNQKLENSHSLRGPNKYTKESWKYSYKQRGEIDNYYGFEQIYFEEELVFYHHAIGGTIIST